jgi:hypothetical protein
MAPNRSPLALVCGLWACSFAANLLAAPPPRVLILDTETPAPEGFVDALRIQAAGVAEVEHSGKVEGSLAQKVEGVAAPLAEREASVGVWVERLSTGEALVYIVTRRKSRVLVEVVRLPGGESPETDRALAIKVRDVLDALLSGAGEPSLEQQMVTPTPAAKPGSTPTPTPTPVPAPPPRSWFWLVQAGFVGVSAGNGSTDGQLGGAIGTGARYRGDGWMLEGLLAGWLLNGTDSAGAGARVQTRELELNLGIRGLLAGDLLAAGVHVELLTRLVTADGTAPDGRTGDAFRVVPALRAGPELRLEFAPNVALRLAIGADLALRRQRFSVTGNEIVDLGGVRGSAEAGVVIALP